MKTTPYLNDYGLLNAKIADINAENAPLWSVEYLLLKKDEELLTNLYKYIVKCQTQVSGLYHQFPTRYNNKDDQMSPDQLIAFIVGLKMAGFNSKIKEIWEYLKKHYGTYDNLQPNVTNRDRMMQLSALAFCGAAVGNKLAKYILSLVCIYSCFTKPNETSGKLKAWVMFKSLDMKFTEAICTFLIRKNLFKTWKDVFFEYFQEDGHPIRELF